MKQHHQPDRTSKSLLFSKILLLFTLPVTVQGFKARIPNDYFEYEMCSYLSTSSQIHIQYPNEVKINYTAKGNIDSFVPIYAEDISNTVVIYKPTMLYPLDWQLEQNSFDEKSWLKAETKGSVRWDPTNQSIFMDITDIDAHERMVKEIKFDDQDFILKTWKDIRAVPRVQDTYTAIDSGYYCVRVLRTMSSRFLDLAIARVVELESKKPQTERNEEIDTTTIMKEIFRNGTLCDPVVKFEYDATTGKVEIRNYTSMRLIMMLGILLPIIVLLDFHAWFADDHLAFKGQFQFFACYLSGMITIMFIHTLLSHFFNVFPTEPRGVFNILLCVLAVATNLSTIVMVFVLTLLCSSFTSKIRPLFPVPFRVLWLNGVENPHLKTHPGALFIFGSTESKELPCMVIFMFNMLNIYKVLLFDLAWTGAVFADVDVPVILPFEEISYEISARATTIWQLGNAFLSLILLPLSWYEFFKTKHSLKLKVIDPILFGVVKRNTVITSVVIVVWHIYHLIIWIVKHQLMKRFTITDLDTYVHDRRLMVFRNSDLIWYAIVCWCCLVVCCNEVVSVYTGCKPKNPEVDDENQE